MKYIKLYTESCEWLGNIVITEDGFFGAVTDYGNFAYQWNSFGDSFEKFLLSINEDYFEKKMSLSLAYIAHSRKVDKGAQRFSEMILPALKKHLSNENS